MKIYTNKHGIKYTYKKKYIIRSISSDGVIKLCSEINARQWTRLKNCPEQDNKRLAIL